MENEIAGTYPIILDGNTEGELKITREGLFWVFEAKTSMRDDIVRLSVFGDGVEGYLGIMEPYGNELQLTKKLSRTALGSFPRNITHAGQKGAFEMPMEESASIPAEPAIEADISTNLPLGYEYDNFSSDNVPPDGDKPPPLADNSPQQEFGALCWQPCAVPCSLFSGIAEKKVCGYIKGAFLAKNEDILFLAVPESIANELPKNSGISFADRIRFSSNDFLICKIKNGKAISEP